MTVKIGVVVPIRDEASNIKDSIDAIKNQSLEPEQVILVDDRLTDGKLMVELPNGIQVIKFPFKHENWVMKKELAMVFNLGLKSLKPDLDYITIVGADEVLPYNHFEYITEQMSQTKDLVIASGTIIGEHNTIPRGSGRIVDWKWWKSFGGVYPINYGFESWLIAKCFCMGKHHRVFSNIKSTMQRPTGTNYSDVNYFHRGQAYKALGYNQRFVLCRALKMLLRQQKLIATKRMLEGFWFSDTELYDDNVRNYYKMIQNNQTSIRNLFKSKKDVFEYVERNKFKFVTGLEN